MSNDIMPLFGDDFVPVPNLESSGYAKNIGKRPILKYISKHLLQVDHRYQRGKTKNIENIAKNFHWAKFGALVVSRHGQRYSIIEGQQRASACMMRPDIDDVPCVVFENLDVRKEAESFIGINERRKSLRAIEKFKAYETSGREDAKSVRDLCNSYGFTIQKRDKNDESAIRTLEGALTLLRINRHGHLGDVLNALLDCWPQSPSRTTMCFVEALSDLHRALTSKYGIGLRHDKILDKLKSKNVEDVLGKAGSCNKLTKCSYREAIFEQLFDHVKLVAQKYRETSDY